MSGRLIGVVGPSGVGKDTVMEGLVARCTGLGLVRRVITRPGYAVGEAFDDVSDVEFERRVQAGDFTLHWGAHGLRYGVPRETEARLAGGEDLLVNLSRAVLGEAQARFRGFTTLHLTAPREVLAGRLAARGRESRADIEARLMRASLALPDGLERVIEISNAGPLEAVLAAIDARLYPVKA
ncbi:MAG: phosphonate metabolism protein/1,5-bisphosphokinase (PRPP-forming) PhnN [Pseudomonadota bacterium]|uniref:phosphonate metabolism protein/1,5-bisphosphokinase (PRPP-forming) PhnN n=1 Tax=Roseovarius TaxID=74030 RepID=UPI0022A8AC2B|nr:phosphonate metabolism protein/1,5-bisphosphokinase (PRPP-forming) PhnN [Roseovarius sp. EGI FJ00037]MCZ0814112.1 phosphonate metabolism protein/1,5-bisphosphokinase (PRPP-forming) PhnN [Roseovarius sp. EGI FJ00037]